jgi:photosystem II stability/assembly factor-like uncharacterized protein
MSETLLMIGTRKGLWLARSSDRRTWTVEGPDDPVNEIHSVAIDKRGDHARLLMGSRSWHWGTQVMHSDDLGQTWQRGADPAVKFPEDTEASLEAVWSLAPSPADPGVVWAGSEPSALWKSTDGGHSFELVRGLWDHPHRPQWAPGGGGQAIHTLLPHPTDPQRLHVAMSTGGVYRTTDGGTTWEPANQGIKVEFNPDDIQYPEWGQCVHKAVRDPENPDRLYAQNHGGVFRSDDAGTSWTSIADGLPSDFGFPVVAHPHRADTIYLFPLVDAGERFPKDGKARVYRSKDAGATWEELGEGLPDGFYTAVMRDAMCADDGDPAGVYLGSRDGTVFASADEGESWSVVTEHLPDVLCVRAATLG